MTGSSDKSGDKRPDASAEDGRGSEGLDSLLNNPAAAMAAATAFGFSMATQMSRFWLGSLQGAMDVTGQLARQLEEERKAAEAKTAAEPETEVEVPVATPEPAPTQAKVKAEKPVSAKAEKPKPAPKAKAASEPKVEAKAAPKSKVQERQLAVVAKALEKTVEKAPARKAGGQADDLKKIDGIGPKLEQVLKGRGIARFSDLAALDEAAVAALDKELGLGGRSLRDDWKGQASRLLKGPAKPRKPRSGK
ncbi:MAG: 5' DNA nuclease [Rhizobium sp.]|nr:5' DNA nuclease [Rhizobium sp.]